MARISVEERLYSDKRWTKLVIKLQDEEKALGALVRAWSTAQHYWKEHDHGIPKGVWKTQELNNALIDAGFAIDNGDFFKMVDSEIHFAWIRQKVKAGQAGGIASGKSRVENIKENSKREEAGASAANPIPITITIPNTKNTNTKNKSKSITPDGFEFCLNEFKNHFPNTTKGPKAVERFREQIKSENDLEDLKKSIASYAAFLKMPVNEWRRPKTSFENFLGTKTSGFFWREFIDFKASEAGVKKSVLDNPEFEARMKSLERNTA